MTAPELADEFRLVALSAVDPGWCDPLGYYAEGYWLPTLRPNAYLLGRRLVQQVRHPPANGAVATLKGLAIVCGLAHAGNFMSARPSPRAVLAGLERLAYRGLVMPRGTAILEVRTAWPRLPGSLLGYLPTALQRIEPELWATDGQSLPTTAVRL